MPAQDLSAMAARADDAHARLTARHAARFEGALAEQRHLLYDADADATVPPFPYPTDTRRQS
ncbi:MULTISPECIES: hypothetical protein [unclassified Streptomyces]|uniref:hypothetical protein n=1 Tax=unclassified Streptomyces TaxID=2593676 RepID=UPI00081F1177|nr:MULTISPECIES: hypothetical protein [unclassified Streptomyces]MYR28647.1 hypothetical protein [Streptomyces sp. SID4945]SCF40072.1 hypothetical protein GA0115257_11563 [Streptomyces sp. LcepLS]